MIDSNPAFLPFFFQEPIYIANETTEGTAYQPLGNNMWRVLVLVDESDVSHLSQESKQLLEKILQAVQLSLDDICLVNIQQAPEPNRVEFELEYSYYITFGMPPEAWQFNSFSKKYVVDKDDTGKAYLWADSLIEIASDVEKKKALWISLKTLFLTE
ncbi:MAG: hypothetical protein AAGE93_23040 [Bacteroidota bacterium]